MITQKEIESVSTMGAFDRYRYFIKKIADANELWYIVDEASNISLSEVESNLLLSFWSAKEYIQSCLTGVWENHTPVSISLDNFEKDLIPIITERHYLMNIFPINNKAGFVVTLEEFIHDLNIELSNYE